MTYRFREGFDPQWIDSIIALHNRTSMKRSLEMREPLTRAFTARFRFISCWYQGEVADQGRGGQGCDKLIAMGSLISDGEMYASVFDLVVDPEFERRGIGREILNRLLANLPELCVFLTSTPGNEPFYERAGFVRQTSAFARFPWASRSVVG